MKTFNANYFEDYSTYTAKKNKIAVQKEKSLKKKKDKKKFIQDQNSFLRSIARQYAEDMKAEPSKLEKMMREFLDNQSIQYDFQRIFYIKNGNGKITKFYIADFYIPSKNLIIEADGAFHKKQIKKDEYRTRDIQKHYPNVKVIRWKWHDFESYTKMKDLIARLK